MRSQIKVNILCQIGPLKFSYKLCIQIFVFYLTIEMIFTAVMLAQLQAYLNLIQTNISDNKILKLNLSYYISIDILNDAVIKTKKYMVLSQVFRIPEIFSTLFFLYWALINSQSSRQILPFWCIVNIISVLFQIVFYIIYLEV